MITSKFRAVIIFLIIGLSVFSCSKVKGDKDKTTTVKTNGKDVDSVSKNNTVKNNFSPEEFLSWNDKQVVENMGDPIEVDGFDMLFVPEFRAGVLNYFDVNDDVGENMLFKELTWNISEDKTKIDIEKERLTIWYAQKKDRRYLRKDHLKLPSVWEDATVDSLTWLPVDYLYWNTDSEF